MPIQLRAAFKSLCRTLVHCAALVLPTLGGCAFDNRTPLEVQIDRVVTPLMASENVPGVAVGVVHGERTMLWCRGVSNLEGTDPVNADTIFEIGSISKTFTALLGAQVVARGHASLSDPVDVHMPDLAGSPIGRVTLRQLATYTAGGLPLQVPDGVSEGTLTAYLQKWTPEFAAGTHRRYSNPSIGYFGRVCAAAAGVEFAEMMRRDIVPALGLRDTYLDVPASAMSRYAMGYDTEGRAVRVNPGVLDDEAYGVKTTVVDLCRYLRVQMHMEGAGGLEGAIEETQRGQYRVGPMTQALGWEYYAYPAALDELLKGNSPEIIFEPQRVEETVAHRGFRLYNKTGSTGGFSAYVLFVPERKVGVVLLTNGPVPIADRIRIAYTILRSVDEVPLVTEGT
ncbi:MAG TPA: class C beta-lactamase [Phycisphaerales bacterium]|nr:class C beta-lactamase [Phycisphaerales bacterium]